MQNCERVRTHLFLVGDELIPNITPALDPDFLPAEVYLLFSSEFENSAKRLENILRKAAIKDVFQWKIDDQWDIEHIGQRVMDFVTSDRHDGDIVLNVSCGTKPMSLAAFDVFQEAKKPVYYVHPETDHVVWLHPRDRKSFDLADKIKLKTYLNAHDLRLLSSRNDGIPTNLRTLTDTLVREVARFADPLTVLNYHASQAEETDNLVSLPVEMHHLQDRDMQQLLDLFSSNGLMKVDSDYRLEFPSEESRFFVNGGWLEEYVFGLLFNLRKDISSIHDLARNLKFEWDEEKSPVTNEIDVAFLADNRHYIIECKTRKFTTKKSRKKSKKAPRDDNKTTSLYSDDAEALYRLRTLKDYLGGTGTKAMLITYRSVSSSTMQRAEEFGVKVCAGDGIREDLLRDSFLKWIRKGC